MSLANRLIRRTRRTDWSAVLVHSYSRTQNVGTHLCKRVCGTLIGLPNEWPPGSIAVDTWSVSVGPIWSEERRRKGASDFTLLLFGWLDGSLVFGFQVCSSRINGLLRT